MILEKLKKQADFLDSVRSYFKQQDFLEVFTPIIVPTPGFEVHLDYFETKWLDYKSQAHTYYLRSSPEIHMKELISKGVKKCFQIAPCFRNGGELSDWHNPEFLMLEWYHTDISFEKYIQNALEFIKEVGKINDKPKFYTLKEVFWEFIGVELIDQDPLLAQKLKSKGVLSITDQDDFESAYFKALLEKVEPNLKGLTVFYDYPPSQAALSKIVKKVAKRFEIYLHGIELCNGFYELWDLEENLKRFNETNEKREKLLKPKLYQDPEFFNSFNTSIDCVGAALGLNRLLALSLGETDLENTLGNLKRLYV